MTIRKEQQNLLFITSLVTLMPILAGLFLWNQLPEQVVTHWDISGTPNGYSSKAFAVFGIPLFLLVIHVLCTFAAVIDPKQQMENRRMFAILFWICPIASIFCTFCIYAAALDMNMRIDIFSQIFCGIVFICIGNYLPTCKRNRVVGIKLPWTLKSDANWEHTHRFARPVWILCGAAIALMVLGALRNFFLIPVILSFLFPTIYSYWYYCKFEK